MQAFRTLQSQYDYATKQIPGFNFIIIILTWFAVTVEVFLRRDFGERYLNRVKIMSGFFLLILWRFISGVGSMFSNPMDNFLMPQEVEPQQPPFFLHISAFTVVLLLYVFVCGYHIFIIWWRNATDRPLHSWDSGKSWLVPLGELFMVFANMLMGLFCRFYALFLPADERVAYFKFTPPVIASPIFFTEKWIEPLFLFSISLVCVAFDVKLVASWLFVSAIALAFFTTLRHEKQMEWYMDFQDDIVNGEAQKGMLIGEQGTTNNLGGGEMRRLLEKAAVQAEKAPEVVQQMRQEAPSLAAAMEALNPKLKNLSASGPNP